jgi:hemerythrin-like metal-binding protein
MTLLIWDKRFSVGIDAVDHEHRELIYLINDVHEALDNPEDGDAVDAMLGSIYNAVAAHFALEERFMQSAQYPEYEAHKEDHEDLLDQIRDLMDSYADDPVSGREQLRTRLSAWFGTHFSTFDSRLHKALLPHGH